MPTLHFLNVLEGDCNIIQHGSGRITVMDVSNAYNEQDTATEKAAKASLTRELKRLRTNVPSFKTNYGQKLEPDNPIEYLKNNIGTDQIFRFIISHPDMDHLDGIKDLYTEFTPLNTWDTDNNKEIDSDTSFAGYNKEDWEFYTQLRAGNITSTNRLTYFDSNPRSEFWNKDGLNILCPSKSLLNQANETGDYNDASYALLYKVKKFDGGSWKILLAGDTHNDSWEHIIRNHEEDVSNIDVLLAPHHGRDSGRNYDFLDVLQPRVTLFGNASSKHLAYDSYPPIRITNNQAGYVIVDISEDQMKFYVKNYNFASDFRSHRGWSAPEYSYSFSAYNLFVLDN